MRKYFYILFLFYLPVKANQVIPNFQTGVLQQHVETKSTVLENIQSFEFRSGYQFTVGGTNVKSSTGNVAPTGWTKQNTTVQGVGTTYVMPNLTNKPEYHIVNEADTFNYYETLETPGLTNYTQIMRETTIESISDSTSTFSQ
tara:strand:- start:154 stop:582 length:429 start_codon:yes stop_codon:yes gene_type:complete